MSCEPFRVRSPTVGGSRCGCPALQLAEALLLRQLALRWSPDLLPLWLPGYLSILLCRINCLVM